MESQLLPDTPHDIVADILSRLPMKSLLRFKCVSKLWLSLISDPKFTFSNAKQKTIVMTWDQWQRSPTLYFIDDKAFVEKIIPKPWKRKRCDFQWRSFYKDEEVFIIGSCNGLLLIRLADNFFLWNPSTRKFIKVLTLDRLFRGDFQIIASGLCYDSSIDDYKAVIALGRQSIDHVLVASFKSKKWIKISFPYDIGPSKHGTLVNACLHWRVKDTCEDRLCAPHKIVYFDSLTDEFREFPTPKREANDKKVIIGLGVLSECLCMARRDYESHYHELLDDIEVLIMKEYGVKGSWTTLFTISNLEMSPCFGDLMLLCLTNNGEILMLKDKKSILVYNPKEKLYRDIWIPNDELFLNGVATFVESLVSPHFLPLE